MAIDSSPRWPKALFRSAVVLGSACLMLGGCSRWIGGPGLPMDGNRHIPAGFQSDTEKREFNKRVDNDSFPPATKAGI